MSYPNRLEPPEPEFTDDEMDAAREQLFTEWAERGWPRADAAEHIDDQLVMEQAEYMRRDCAATHEDIMRAHRKEGM